MDSTSSPPKKNTAATVGVLTETNADKAIEELRAYEADVCTVLRDGRWIVMPASELVPGDVVEVAVGAKVPADIRVCALLSTSVRADQARSLSLAAGEFWCVGVSGWVDWGGAGGPRARGETGCVLQGRALAWPSELGLNAGPISHACRLAQSILTGESGSVAKTTEPVTPGKVVYQDKTNTLFSVGPGVCRWDTVPACRRGRGRGRARGPAAQPPDAAGTSLHSLT